MSSLGVTCRTKPWEAHEHDQQFEENEAQTLGRVKDFAKRAMLESTRCRP